jgi:hypothetical protein
LDDDVLSFMCVLVQAMVQIDTKRPTSRVKAETKTTRVRTKQTNGDLPEGCQTGSKWRRVFVPTYMHYVAGCSNPWAVADDVAQDVLQIVWDEIYGGEIPHTVDMASSVLTVVGLPSFEMSFSNLHFQANQRIHEWRSSFGSNALSMITTFFDSHDEFKSNDSRIRFAEEMLEDLAFCYEDTDDENPEVCSHQQLECAI